MKTFIIAKYTLKDIIKSKILLVAVFLGFLNFLISYIASELSYAVASRVALDFGMGLLSFCLPAISIFYGVTTLSKDIEQRTIYMTITRSITRAEYFLGKFFGVMSGVIIIQLIMTFFTLQSYFLLGGENSPLIFFNLILSLIESMILYLFSMILSLVSNISLSISGSIIFFFTSHAISESLKLNFLKGNIFLEKTLMFFHYIFPELDKLNIKPYLIYSQSVSLDYIYTSSLYGFSYCIGLALIGIFIFTKKELD